MTPPARPAFTTVIFDVGGVLVRTEDRRPRTMLADAFGMTYTQIDEIIFNSESGRAAQRGEITADAHWEWVRERLDLKPDEIGPVKDTFFSGDVLDIALIDALRPYRDHVRLAILSNAPDDARALLTGKYRLDEMFSPIVISAEEKVVKPDPEIYRIALRKCEAEPEQSIFIDDFPQNIAAAQALGMHAVWFRSREQVLGALAGLLNER